MKRLSKASLALGLLAGTATIASAITFTDVTVAGSTGSWSVIGSGNGIRFVMPDAYVIPAGNKTITLSYRVDATPGYVLDSYTAEPTGSVKNGTVGIQVQHVAGANTLTDSYVVNAGSSVLDLSGFGFGLDPVASGFNVTHTIDLAATRGMAKLTAYTVQYTEAVPEPASVAALVAGLGFLASRKFRRNR